MRSPRTPKRIRQKMYYANPTGRDIPIYEKDEDGNIIYVLIGGEEVPKESDVTVQEFTEPVVFWNSITSTLTPDELEAFGNEPVGKVKMTYHSGEYPFKVGTLVWKNSEIGYVQDGLVDKNTADYRVLGIMATGQRFWRCILEEVVKHHDD